MCPDGTRASNLPYLSSLTDSAGSSGPKTFELYTEEIVKRQSLFLLILGMIFALSLVTPAGNAQTATTGTVVGTVADRSCLEAYLPPTLAEERSRAART